MEGDREFALGIRCARVIDNNESETQTVDKSLEYNKQNTEYTEIVDTALKDFGYIYLGEHILFHAYFYNRSGYFVTNISVNVHIETKNDITHVLFGIEDGLLTNSEVSNNERPFLNDLDLGQYFRRLYDYNIREGGIHTLVFHLVYDKHVGSAIKKETCVKRMVFNVLHPLIIRTKVELFSPNPYEIKHDTGEDIVLVGESVVLVKVQITNESVFVMKVKNMMFEPIFYYEVLCDRYHGRFTPYYERKYHEILPGMNEVYNFLLRPKKEAMIEHKDEEKIGKVEIAWTSFYNKNETSKLQTNQITLGNLKFSNKSMFLLAMNKHDYTFSIENINVYKELLDKKSYFAHTFQNLKRFELEKTFRVEFFINYGGFKIHTDDIHKKNYEVVIFKQNHSENLLKLGDTIHRISSHQISGNFYRLSTTWFPVERAHSKISLILYPAGSSVEEAGDDSLLIEYDLIIV